MALPASMFGGSSTQASRRRTGSFEIRNADEIARDIATLAKELRDFRPAWDRLTPRLKTAVDKIVASRGSLVGVPWPGNDPEYLKAKGGGSLLRKTGAMLGGLRRLSNAPMSMRFGVRAPQAPAMNFGRRKYSKGTPKRIGGNATRVVGKWQSPPRPFLFSAKFGTSEEVRRVSHEEIERWVEVLLGRMRSMRSAA